MHPTLIALAGPNGAGKSTFSETFLSDKGMPFINADVLAKELDLEAIDAADSAQKLREQFLLRGESFITETVFSDPVGSKLSFFERAEQAGYEVTLIYIGLSSSRLSSNRVAIRTRAGGHDVPKEKLPGRYLRSLHNLKKASHRLSHVIVFDNSDARSPYKLVAEFAQGNCITESNTSPKWFWQLFSNEN